MEVMEEMDKQGQQGRAKKVSDPWSLRMTYIYTRFFYIECFDFSVNYYSCTLFIHDSNHGTLMRPSDFLNKFLACSDSCNRDVLRVKYSAYCKIVTPQSQLLSFPPASSNY